MLMYLPDFRLNCILRYVLYDAKRNLIRYFLFAISGSIFT